MTDKLEPLTVRYTAIAAATAAALTYTYWDSIEPGRAILIGFALGWSIRVIVEFFARRIRRLKS